MREGEEIQRERQRTRRRNRLKGKWQTEIQHLRVRQNMGQDNRRHMGECGKTKALAPPGELLSRI